MNTATNRLERAKIAELAREYESRGYDVIVQPSTSDMPEFLRESSYQPDLLVTSEGENLLIDVKTRDSMRDSQYLAEISKLVRANRNWDLLLVYTNPRRKPERTLSRERQTETTMFEALAAATDWIGGDQSKHGRISALLFMWSILEAAVMAALPESPESFRVRTPLSLLRDAVIAGVISKGEYQFLERLMKRRNEVAHGNLSQQIAAPDLEKLARICQEILTGARA